MSRISESFMGKKAFIGFLTAGDPSLEKTKELIMAMERAGAALIEIGIPFSDPIAEGPVIQDANIRALSAPGGCTTEQVFTMVDELKGKVTVPLVFLTYLNPVFKYGYEAFCRRCQKVGISGLIIPDLPYEERDELENIAQNYDVELISLIAPTSKERIRKIAEKARGYLYLVSSMGVTGVREEITTDLKELITEIRQVTDTPIAIGFGISSPEQAMACSSIADGVIVGSAIVKRIGEYGEQATEPVENYVISMVEACKGQA
ncbi:MAG: tryptophan synthase subunit alpha [Lachnospiraceae bacterium]|nr:tryptophan synthase subunit alpha [Lachnospiraceae bacterium]